MTRTLYRCPRIDRPAPLAEVGQAGTASIAASMAATHVGRGPSVASLPPQPGSEDPNREYATRTLYWRPQIDRPGPMAGASRADTDSMAADVAATGWRRRTKAGSGKGAEVAGGRAQHTPGNAPAEGAAGCNREYQQYFENLISNNMNVTSKIDDFSVFTLKSTRAAKQVLPRNRPHGIVWPLDNGTRRRPRWPWQGRGAGRSIRGHR